MFLLLLSGLAWAQDGNRTTCGALIGVTVPVYSDRRDWDLSVNTRTVPVPSATATCFFGGVWVGVDVQPGLQHTYERLSGRGPMTTTVSFGLPLIGGPPLRLSSWVFANRSARGFGGAVSSTFDERTLQLRVGVAPGPVPMVLGALHFTPSRTWGPFVEHGPVTMGFEVGTMNAVRFDVSVVDPELGLAVNVGMRAGVLHRPPRDVLFVPLVMASSVAYYVDDDVQIALVQLSAGAAVDGTHVRPVWGLAAPLGGEVLRFAFGVLVVHEPSGPRGFADATFSLNW